MTPTERVARATYDTFMGPLLGCCEPTWDNLPEGHRVRMCDAAEAAIRATLAALREFHPLTGWTGTAASLIGAFEREHLGDKP